MDVYELNESHSVHHSRQSVMVLPALGLHAVVTTWETCVFFIKALRGPQVIFCSRLGRLKH